MRGSDQRSGALFSYVDLEQRVPATHRLRTIRTLVNAVIGSLDAAFDALYENTGRDSIAPERLLRASLLQAFYLIRSECQLMAQRPTVGADKAYDAAHFVADLRQRRITPACRTEGPIARDRRAHHPAPGRRSARKRKLVEEAFGWAKIIAGLAKVKVRVRARVRFPFVLAMAAYDLIRMPQLLASASG